MRTRKFVALLLVLVMSLTMGGMAAFAEEPEKDSSGSGVPVFETDTPNALEMTGFNDAESGDTDPNSVGPDDTNTGDIDLNGTALDETEPDGTESNPAEKPQPGITVTGVPTTPVKAGDTVSYTVKVDPEGADMAGWKLIINDGLKEAIDTRNGQEEPGEAEKIDISAKNEVTVSYQIPEKFYISEDSFSVYAEVEDEETTLEMSDFYEIPAQKTLTSSIVFDTTKKLITGREYPFTATWTNAVDYTIENFSVEIFNLTCSEGYTEGGAHAALKVTKIPDGASAEVSKGAISVNQLSIPAGGTVTISGTVSFPLKGSGELRFSEMINGALVGQIGTPAYEIVTAEASDENGNGTSTPQPGTVLKDNATGITVSGTETGVELKVETSISQEKKKDIEDKVKKLVGDARGIKIFDISLWMDNKEIQPGTPVTVTIPIPEGFSKNLVLYHQNTQGELDRVDINIKESTVSFEAKSFSPYILVDLGEKAANTAANTPQRAPRTADTSSIMLYLMLALAAGCVGVLTRRKVNN